MGWLAREQARLERDEQMYPMKFGYMNSYWLFGSKFDKWDYGPAWKKWVSNEEEK